MTKSEFRLFGWRHFSRRAIHQVEIPWAIDRDKNQIFFIGLGPRLVNHLARHAIVEAGTQFPSCCMMKVPLMTVCVSFAVCQCFGA